jgi:hypothetical protein
VVRWHAGPEHSRAHSPGVPLSLTRWSLTQHISNANLQLYGEVVYCFVGSRFLLADSSTSRNAVRAEAEDTFEQKMTSPVTSTMLKEFEAAGEKLAGVQLRKAELERRKAKVEGQGEGTGQNSLVDTLREDLHHLSQQEEVAKVCSHNERPWCGDFQLT